MTKRYKRISPPNPPIHRKYNNRQQSTTIDNNRYSSVLFAEKKNRKFNKLQIEVIEETRK